MKPAKNYAYSKGNLEILSEALESLANLKVLLSKDNILDSDELLIKLNYQFLGNCLKKLTYSCIMGDEELKALIFWARAENPDRHSHLFDRMDTAHGTNFLWFVNPSNAFTRDRARWLEECGALTDLIKRRLSAADLKTNRRATIGAHDSFNLDVATHPHFRKGTVIENCLGNIYQALAIVATVNVNAKTLPTPPNMAIILLANQVIGENIKRLIKLGYKFGDALTAANIKAIIDNRNIIAHAKAFSAFVALQTSCFYTHYVECYKVLREVMKPLAEPLMISAATVDDVLIEEENAEDNSPVLESLRSQAHLKLFQELQALGLIDQAKEPKLDPENKIFSDTELCHILISLISNKKPELFDEILSNIKCYTDTKAKSLINTPLLYTAQDQSEVDNVGFISYLPSDRLNYITANAFSHRYRYINKFETKYPKIRYVYLLEYAFRAEGWEEDNGFALKLLDMGANPNIEVGTKQGLQSLLWAALSDKKFSAMSLLVSYGADPDPIIDSEKQTLLQCIVMNSYPPRIDIIEELINFGADPRQHVHQENAEGHIIAAIIFDRGRNDKETFLVLRTMINLMVKKYGFDAIQAMLDSKVSYSKYQVSVNEILPKQTYKNVSRRGSLDVTLLPQPQSHQKITFAAQKLNFVDMVNTQSEDFIKPTCTRLINLLVGLKDSKGCELFKVVLTDNVEMIKAFLEEEPIEVQRDLLNEDLFCKGRMVGIVEFAKLFCDKAVQAFVVRLKIQLQSSSTLATLESKEGRDDSKENNVPTPLALGSAAGMVTAAQPQERNASTSLSCVPANFINLDCRKALIVGALVAVCAALLFAELYQKRDYSSERMI